MLRTLQYCIGAPAVVLMYTVSGMADSPAQEPLPTIRHDAELRFCPSLECRVVAQLPILSSVYVHEKVSANEQVDEEYWAYVATEGSRQMGWIFERHVGYPESFAPVRSWPVESFGYCMGEYCPEFSFTEEGSFTVMYRACFDGLCPDPPDEARCFGRWDERVEIDGHIHCLWRGKLYRSGDAVRAGGPDSREFLYFDKRGRLCADASTCQVDGENSRAAE